MLKSPPRSPTTHAICERVIGTIPRARLRLIELLRTTALSAPYPGFIEPCHATQRNLVPKHGSRLHEIKHDGSPYS